MRQMKKQKAPGTRVRVKDVRYFSSPLTVTGKKYPSWRITYYLGTRRVRERRKTEEEAKARAEELVRKLGDGSIHFDLKLKPKDHVVIAEALRLLHDAGGKTVLLDAVRQFVEAEKCLAGQCSLMEAVREHKRQLDKGKLQEIKVPELVVEFLAHLNAEGLSKRYRMDMKAKLNVAAKMFTGHVADVRTVDVDNWLDSLTRKSKRTKKNYRNALQTLFSFAREKNYLPRQLKTEVEYSRDYQPEKPAIGIYTPEKLELLLSRISPRLVPFVALGALAGMRSAEIVRMEWGDIRLDTKQIFVTDAVSKTIAREIPICPALAEWLKPFKKQKMKGNVLVRISNGLALAKRFSAAVKRITGEDGKPLVKIVRNGFRHTYISCRVKLTKNVQQVSLEAGNSPRIIFSNYLRIIEKQAVAKRWFNIFPTAERLKEITAAIAEGL